jgi:halimadienyl-diphosphate synthase
VGASPAATAHFALYVKPGDQSALQYLSRIVTTHNGGAPALSPFEVFECVWVLWNLSLTNLYQTDKAITNLCDARMDYLEKQWKPGQGLALSEFFSVPDADDTIVGYEILSKFGRKPELDAVLQYEDKEWFRCYHYEANPSVDVNIHVLGALKQAGYDKSDPSIQKALNFIRSKRIHNRYWLDKWNLSAYYTTSHLIIAARGYDDQLCEDSINWILETQEPTGSWGFFNVPTAEETAYCIQALVLWQRYTGKSFREQIRHARQWLSENCEPPYPPLWIGKSLYCPDILVKSCLLSALTLAQES